MVDMTPKVESTALELHAGELAAWFLPELGMLGASLEHRSEEILGRVDDIAGFALAGRVCGIPLLHPWANRLAGASYRFDGRDVKIDSGSALLYHDSNGLLMHGVPWSHLAWDVVSNAETSTTARLDWTTDARLAVFPFPHHVEMTVALDAQSLSVDTTVQADAGAAVPVSFGFHPYFTLPGSTREHWRLALPAMQHLLLDEQSIPTGDAVPFPALEGPLGLRSFDDGFALLEPHGQFSLSGGGRRITVELVEGYEHLQIYAPADQDYISIEPMTAPANALISGDGLRSVAPGDSFHARFRIGVETTY
jgi:aldose 1-epimerase